MRSIATLVCIALIGYLIWCDRKRQESFSNALWVPVLWMFLAGSRYVTSWLNFQRSLTLVDTYNEGSPVDAFSFFLLIFIGIIILLKRKINWLLLLNQNKWILIYFVYCALSIGWSDAAFVSTKRYVKDMGNVVMVLIILTEKHPYKAIEAILRRLSFLLLPLSLLFIRYFPDMGRSYSYGGQPMYTGVGHQKNDLGSMCMISGIYYSWNVLINQRHRIKWLGKENLVDFLFLALIAYLLHMSQSSTSLACLIVAVGLFFVSRASAFVRKPRRIITLLIIAAFLFWISDKTIGIQDSIYGFLGRDATLTDRTNLWEIVKRMATNPFVGTGFMSFWSGERLGILWTKIGSNGVNQAHNGYLEQYLNLGYIGVALIGLLIISGLFKIRKQLDFNFPSAMLRLCFVMVAVLYNYTEASFYGINNIWILTLLAIFDISGKKGFEVNSNEESPNISISKWGSLK
jgi:exopolysaccharide production protein ExoQ